MHIVIVGLGNVGAYLARVLSAEEHHDVVGIDVDKHRLEMIRDAYDIHTIEGYGAAPHALKQADTPNADVFIAVTGNDELNIVAALIAKKLGARFTIAQVSNPLYLEREQVEDYEELGINVLISPERRIAMKMYRSLLYPHFLKVDTLRESKVHINQYWVSLQNPFAHKKIKETGLAGELLIVGLARNQEFLFPTGDTVILPNDILFIVGDNETMQRINHLLPVDPKTIRRIIILGANQISYFFAKLVEATYRVIIIDPDEEACTELAQQLDRALVYHDNIFTSNILDELLLNEHDYFIAATDIDETNLLSTMLMKDKGLSMLACIVHQSHLLPIIKKVGIYQAFSPQLVISDEILSSIRSRELVTLPDVQNISAEFVEITVHPDSDVVNQEIRQLYLPEQTLFAAVIRNEKVYVPRGDFILHAHDNVIVFCLKDNFDTIHALLSHV